MGIICPDRQHLKRGNAGPAPAKGLPNRAKWQQFGSEVLTRHAAPVLILVCIPMPRAKTAMADQPDIRKPDPSEAAYAGDLRHPRFHHPAGREFLPRSTAANPLFRDSGRRGATAQPSLRLHACRAPRAFRGDRGTAQMTNTSVAGSPGEPVRVSVILITYNHASYIARAVESVLSQVTDFPFEVLISEDCSTDGTRELIQSYADRFPGRIRLLLSPANINTNEVFARALRAAAGEYIATLDGDDFWVGTDKLQKQVAFLEGNPACSMCFHQVSVLHPAGHYDPQPYTALEQPLFSSIADLWTANFIASCSPLIRRSALGELPSWYEQAFFGDWPLYLLAAENGPIGYLPETMATYRYHGTGLWSRLSRTEQLEATRRFLEQMHAYFPPAYRGAIRRQAGELVHALMAAHRASGSRGQALRTLMNWFNARVVLGSPGRRRILGVMLGRHAGDR